MESMGESTLLGELGDIGRGWGAATNGLQIGLRTDKKIVFDRPSLDFGFLLR